MVIGDEFLDRLLSEKTTKILSEYRLHCLLSHQVLSCKTLGIHAKRDPMGIAKSIDPSQPAHSAQSDQDRNFSLLADFLCIE